jgi:hypothetical protein
MTAYGWNESGGATTQARIVAKELVLRRAAPVVPPAADDHRPGLITRLRERLTH